MLPWLTAAAALQPWLWLSSRTPGTSLPPAVCGVTRASHPGLPHPALPCGMHGRALLTVKHLGEGFKVLQRAHHPRQREGTHLHGNCCSGEQKVVWSFRIRLQFRIRDALGNIGNMSSEMPEQSGFGPAPSPVDWQIHQVGYRCVLSSRVLQAMGENLEIIQELPCVLSESPSVLS